MNKIFKTFVLIFICLFPSVLSMGQSLVGTWENYDIRRTQVFTFVSEKAQMELKPDGTWEMRLLYKNPDPTFEKMKMSYLFSITFHGKYEWSGKAFSQTFSDDISARSWFELAPDHLVPEEMLKVMKQKLVEENKLLATDAQFQQILKSMGRLLASGGNFKQILLLTDTELWIGRQGSDTEKYVRVVSPSDKVTQRPPLTVSHNVILQDLPDGLIKESSQDGWFSLDHLKFNTIRLRAQANSFSSVSMPFKLIYEDAKTDAAGQLVPPETSLDLIWEEERDGDAFNLPGVRPALRIPAPSSEVALPETGTRFSCGGDDYVEVESVSPFANTVTLYFSKPLSGIMFNKEGRNRLKDITILYTDPEQKRLADEEKARLAAEEEQKKLAAEAEQKRLAEEAEQKRIAAEAEQKKAAAEAEQKRLAEEAEQQRLAEEAQQKKVAEEAEQKRIAAEAEQKRFVAEKEAAEKEAVRQQPAAPAQPVTVTEPAPVREKQAKKSVETEDGLRIMVDGGYLMKLTDAYNYAGANLIVGYRTGNLFFGAGAGLLYAMGTETSRIANDAVLSPSAVNIPVFAHVRCYFPMGGIAPFVGLSAGLRVAPGMTASYPLADVPYNASGGLVVPQAGLALPLSGKSEVYFSLGYVAQSRAKVEKVSGPTITFSNPFYSGAEFRVGITF